MSLKKKSGCVNFMSEIGWPDPFGNEDKASKKQDGTLNTPVLEDEDLSKMVDLFNEAVELKTVMNIAFPSKVFMTRMMRSCMNVKIVQDLWIYRPEIEYNAY